MKRTLLLIANAVLAIAGFGQNFPFPMNENGYEYPYGIVASSAENEKIQSKFLAWETKMYTESGEYGRIKYDDGNYTVSEGIAYGMLIYVYMTNSENTQCQDHFDKLYSYYLKWSDSKGLMHWKIQGFNNVDNGGYNAATDADLDVALALCLAAKQWGSSSKYVYSDEAEKILKNIYSYEVFTKNGKRWFKPGDSWDNCGNPCYFTTASVGVYQQTQEYFDFTAKDWATVYKDAHSYLELTQRNGVWPNWSDWNGNPTWRSWITKASEQQDEMNFGWDACRVPWRISWDYVWFGNESSKKMMDNTIELLDTKGWNQKPSSVGYMTGLDGSGYSSIKTTQFGGNVAWTGSVGCAFMTNDSRQADLDVYYNQLKSTTGGAYYAQTLQVLYMLLMSGNAANFYDCEGGSAIVSNPSITAAETNENTLKLTVSKSMKSSSNYNNFKLFVNGSEVSNPFSSMNVDNTTITLYLQNSTTIQSGDIVSISYNGTTLVSQKNLPLNSAVKIPVTNKIYSTSGSTLVADCENDKKTLLGGEWYSYVGNGSASYEIVSGSAANATAHSAHFTYNNISDYAGMGFSIQKGDEPYDFAGSTGFSFYHKGNAATLEIGTASVNDYSYHYIPVQYHNDWTLVTVNWSQVQSTNWGIGSSLDFVLDELSSELTKFQWKETSGSGEFWIDEFSILGRSISDDEVNRKDFEATIVSANTLYSSASTENHPQSAITTFLNNLNQALVTYENPEASQTQIDAANTALKDAITTFKATTYADKAKLKNAISSANSLKSKAVVGEENGMYRQSAVDSLTNAIIAANIIYEKDGAIESEVQLAVSDLNTAIDKFKASEIYVLILDTEKLDEYINLATKILAETTVGENPGQYPSDKRTKLEDALSKAKTGRATATRQMLIDNFLSNLKYAYNVYVNSVVTSVDDVEFALSVFPNPCTDYITIQTSDEISLVTIIGTNGSKAIFEIEQNEVQIPVLNYKNGVYVMQITFTDGTVKTTRFIKK